MEKTYDWIIRSWNDKTLEQKIRSVISDNKNIELTIDQIFRLNFDYQNQSVTVRPFSDTSYFHCKIIPKRITYSAVLKLLDKNFDDISEDDIVEIHE